jgi:hypothetical protein
VNTAFYVVSTLFLLALAGLAFTAVRWALRRDRAARTDPARTDRARTHPSEPGPPINGPATGP